LISTAIFVTSIAALITIFIVITRVQVKESSVAEVQQQAQFLQTQIQYYIQNARLVDMSGDTPSGVLKLRESNLSADPTYIFQNITNGLAGYRKLDEGAGTSTVDSSGNRLVVHSLRPRTLGLRSKQNRISGCERAPRGTSG
jgi:hypothetical protein